MIRRSWLLILSLMLLVGCTQSNNDLTDSGLNEAAASLENPSEQDEGIKISDQTAAKSYIQTQGFLRAELIDKAMRETANEQIDQEMILGGIVPHHDVSYAMMGRFYKTISQDGIDLVIMIGPNHFGTNDGVLTFDGIFATFLGDVETDSEMVNRLVETGVCSQSQNNRFEMEHSLNIQMPFVADAFLDAKILPILIGEEQRMDVVMGLVAALENILDDYDGRVMIIGTVDFSHYLDSERTAINDEMIIELIDAEDTNAIMQLDDGYVDAPSVLTLMMTLFSDSELTMLEHSNAEMILGEIRPGEMTSYMTYIFHQ